MAYVPVPKDLTAVKSKVFLNLTKRQLICFGGGALIGVPLFFLLKQHISTSAAALCMIFVMLPCFLLAMYEKQGLPLEKILRNMIRVYFIRPKHRPYETNNFYSALARQEKLDKEVQRIVYGKAAHRSRLKQQSPTPKDKTKDTNPRRIPFRFSGCSQTVSAV